MNTTSQQPLVPAQVQLPRRLAEAVEELVREGWYADSQAVVVDAVRRFLTSHRPELMERFARDDVEWGLRGRD